MKKIIVTILVLIVVVFLYFFVFPDREKTEPESDLLTNETGTSFFKYVDLPMYPGAELITEEGNQSGGTQYYAAQADLPEVFSFYTEELPDFSINEDEDPEKGYFIYSSDYLDFMFEEGQYMSGEELMGWSEENMETLIGVNVFSYGPGSDSRLQAHQTELEGKTVIAIIHL